MPEYLWPCGWGGVSDTYWDHRNRTPPSVNPGTDITCGYGSDVWATRPGTVTGMSRTNSGSGGRYVQISNDNGTRSQYLHLSEIDVVLGQRVEQGEHIALSGASGFGSDWGYGPHLHKSLMVAGSNVDFQLYSSPSGWSAVDVQPITPEEELFLMSQFEDLWARVSEGIARLDNQVIPDIKTIAGIVGPLADDEGNLRNVIQRENRGRLFTNRDTGEKIAINLFTGWREQITLGTDGGAGHIAALKGKQFVGQNENPIELVQASWDSMLDDADNVVERIADRVVAKLQASPEPAGSHAA